MTKLSINQLELKGKPLFIRVDFNVPLDAGKVQDDTRIRAALPTIRYAREAGAQVILASHLGRPKGEPDPDMSLRPAAERLSGLLEVPVSFSAQTIGPETKTIVDALEDGDVLLLENLRFNPGETKNDADFARQLAELAELYVNDAFGTAHRAHASTVGMVAHFPKAAAGFLMEKELHYLDMALSSPPRPFTGLLGGAKVSDKIEVVNNLLDKVDKLLIGGGMAYTFLRAKGLGTGKSLVEEDKVDLARELLERAGEKLVLPIDHVVAEALDDKAARKTVPIDQTPEGWMGLDIGPETVAIFGAIIRESKMVVWNGPMGVFEKESFAQGTLKVAEAAASSEAISIVGGGDSVSAVHKSGVADRISHISTGGGASLEFLAGLKLPGVEVLSDA
jgi:phosphoglycerate kinase